MIQGYGDLAGEVLRRAARLGGARLVAVDGPSGAGKTEFSGRLAAALRAAGASVAIVHTDDLLDGWRDQFTFWPRLEEQVLRPLRAGRAGGYHPYDWHHDRFHAGRIAVPVADVVILDGVSTARAAARPELTLAVFVTVPDQVALERAVRRDGAGLRPYLERWQRAEGPHFAADGTAASADLVVDGAADTPPDRFVRVDAVADVGHDRR